MKRTPAIGVSLDVERGPHPGIARPEVVRRLRAMIADLQLQDREVSFLLTDDERIHQLNKVYRHKDKPTDVLAFAMHEGELGELAGSVLGDVVVSVPTARKQAQERGASVLDEVTMLLAHGLLHLLGWDHQTAREDRRMRAETDRLCGVAGAVAPRPAAAKAPRRTASAAPAARSKGGAKREIGSARGTSRPKKAQAAQRVRGRRSRKG